ncbi:hypothetical protein LshimejAT787_1100680 [Lyophyllum shimeji]|uniref:BTB domain-containing protein n=1 Tax=Lyophyllum shimeji TaxID=47721 RepID=A0A9P3UQW7_LYOSH|nr:hypothetical protein LshimejAT787_1100680 [Lyophyllum shimeji]
MIMRTNLNSLADAPHLPAKDNASNHKLTTPTIKKDESVYYDKGDIVLLSSPEDDVITAFKVDKVFLMRFSKVFEGMLETIPSDSVSSEDTYDGVPFVELQDKASDLASFLKALYDSSVIPLKRLQKPPFRQ